MGSQWFYFAGILKHLAICKVFHPYKSPSDYFIIINQLFLTMFKKKRLRKLKDGGIISRRMI